MSSLREQPEAGHQQDGRDYYIGLMSGTSMDAVDAALVALSDASAQLVAVHKHAIPDRLRARLERLVREGGGLDDLGRLDVGIGSLFADAALALIEHAGVARDAVRAIGSHGQTVRHRPDNDVPFTLQIGDPNVIAERTGITTVADFRRRDMAAGGEGAPLVPAFHAAVFRNRDEDRVVLNIGGIANVTVLPADSARPVTGFDTGPGNALLDDWAARHLGEPMDRNGAWAAKGRVHEPLLAQLLADPYFERRPPKSTGREHFNLSWLERAVRGLAQPPSPRDIQATLTELTAVTIARAVHRWAPETRRLLVCGGGIHNTDLVRRLRIHLPCCAVESTAAYGLNPDWVEAAAFAWLARQTLAGRPGNLPTVTGADRPVVLGGIYKA